MGSNPVAAIYTSDIAPVLSKEFLDTEATIQCRFTLKLVLDMSITYNLHTKPEVFRFYSGINQKSFGQY